MVEQLLHLDEIRGGRYVQGDRAEPLYAFAVDAEFFTSLVRRGLR